MMGEKKEQIELWADPRNIGKRIGEDNLLRKTATPARGAVFAGAGVVVQLGSHWNVNAYYNADFGRQDYIGHMISGGINFAF